MDSYGWLSILPPLLAIFLAIKTKHVYLSLTLGIWLGWTIMNNWNPLTGAIQTVDALVGVFANADSTRVILFSAMIGATRLMQSNSPAHCQAGSVTACVIRIAIAEAISAPK